MKEKKDYINFKLQKAAQSLKEARLLMQNDMHDTAVSRLYYAAFYAVNALLIAYGFNPKTHSGSKTILIKSLYLQEKLIAVFLIFIHF